MKVKFSKDEEYLWMENWKEYVVFAIELWKWFKVDEKNEQSWEKFYIKAKWPKFVYPIDISDCIITDPSLPDFWIFWIWQSWEFFTWPWEILKKPNFWEDYYNENAENFEIVWKYLNMLW